MNEPAPTGRSRLRLWTLSFCVLLLLGAAAYWTRHRLAPDSRPAFSPAANTVNASAPPPDKPAPTDKRTRPPAAKPEFTLPQFVEVAANVGIHFDYVRGEGGHFWPVEPVGGGAGWLDYDQDGWVDLVLVSGTQLPVDPAKQFLATRLFRNVAGERFEDVTGSADIWSHDYGQGCAVADFDNDGFDDLYVTNYGRCALYHNNADGTFREVTDAAGVPGGQWNTGACFADLNRDGVLDLFVAGYFHFTTENYQPCRSSKGNPEYCGPSDAPALADLLYQGRGDGTFQDVSAVLGKVQPLGPGFGAVAADLDNDQWPDLYVANDAWANFLFHNVSETSPNGDITLDEIAYDWGGAVNADGVPQASMGLACADFDRNGFLDLAVSNFTLEYTTLYLNFRDQYLVDSSHRLGLVAATHSTMGWGLGFIDYDNDGWLDLFVANGHINRNEYGSQPYEMKAHLFHNDHGERLMDVNRWSGPYFSEPVIGRGVALGDYDNDGQMDLAVVHHHRPASLLKNQTATDNGSVSLRLTGRASNRDALNARLIVWLAPEQANGEAPMIIREIVSGDSYLSSNDRKICIGIGGSSRVLRGEIHWPSGHTQMFGELPAGTSWQAIEGTTPEVDLRDCGKIEI